MRVLIFRSIIFWMDFGFDDFGVGRENGRGEGGFCLLCLFRGMVEV